MSFNFNDVEDMAPGRATTRCAPYRDVEAYAIEQMRFHYGYAPERLDPSGKIIRFGKEPGKASGPGWYAAHPDGVPAVIFGHWALYPPRVDVKGTDRDVVSRVPGNALRTITAAEWEEARRWAAEASAEYERERMDADRDARARCQELYNTAPAADPKHQYLVRKGIRPLGDVRQDPANGDLLVPMYEQDRLAAYQRIAADGTKRFPRSCIVAGRYGTLPGKDFGPLLLCEGYATACTLNMATGLPVVIAFHAGNLLPVCKTIRERFQKRHIIICADNDQWPDKNGNAKPNVGIEKARRAADGINNDNVEVVYPTFADPSSRPTDFNDLAALDGLDAVRLAVSPDGLVPTLSMWGAEAYEGAPAKQEWIVENFLPAKAACLLAAAGGTGKGMLEIDLALRVAGLEGDSHGFDFGDTDSRLWLGHRVVRHGTVVALFAEDNKEDIHRRIRALDPAGKRLAAAAGRLFLVPLPATGGPITLVRGKQAKQQGFEKTEAMLDILKQLQGYKDLALIVVDPLASFVACDINADPQAGQFVQGMLAYMAERTGACVLVAHHVVKKDRKPGQKSQWSADTARDSIRGTSALVDGVRLAIAILPASPKDMEGLSKELGGREIGHNDMFFCAVVKANMPADMVPMALLRNRTSGLLEQAGRGHAGKKGPTVPYEEKLCLLLEAVAEAAGREEPFTMTGNNGLYARRACLPAPLCRETRDALADMANDAIQNERIKTVRVGRKTGYSVLDVPGGHMATFDKDAAEKWTFHKGASSRGGTNG